MIYLRRWFGRATLRRCALLCFSLMAILASRASAVVIINTDGSANNGQTSATGTTAPYANVGLRANGGATVVYLGNDWAITANHAIVNPVGTVINDAPYGNITVPNTPESTITDPGNNTIAIDNYVTLNGQQITIDQAVQVLNSNGSPTDMKLVHLTSDPGLPAVQIAGVAPSDNQSVVMIGAGNDLGTQQGYTIDSQSYTGYPLLSSEGVPRWGTNAIDPGSVSNSLNDLGESFTVNNVQKEAYEYTFTTTFANSPSVSNQEAQATSGDSGGGVFEQIAGTWYLVGLIDGLTTVPYGSGPNDYNYNVYFGEQSVMADVAPYQSVIAAVVPEPSGLVLGAIGAGMALLAALRARRRQIAVEA